MMHDLSEAEQGAFGLRIHWGLGLDPIPNLVEPLEERGIKVLAMNLPAIDGLTARVRREKGQPASVIVVNGGDWGERQRLTVAHEVGHMVLDVSPKLNKEKAAHRSGRDERLRTDEAIGQASDTRGGRDSRCLSFSSMARTDSPVSIAVELATLRIRRRFAFAVSRR